MSKQTDKVKPKERPHYVNNKEFSQAVYDYAVTAHECKEREEVVPKVPDYIAECFLKISEGLSYKPNFIRYPFREEMVMDAVENCLKAIYNYDISKVTRTGNPNAFAYFTQIAWYAFLRRIQKEKKQLDIKFKFIEQGGYEDFFVLNEDELYNSDNENTFVDELRSRINRVHEQDRILKEFERAANEDAGPLDDNEDCEEPKGLELFAK